MHYWLMKSEPETWSWDDQVAAGETGEIWDGVRNHQAARFMRQMAAGDLAWFYHSGRQRRIMGSVEIIEPAFVDPTDPEGRFVAVRVVAREALPVPVTLARIKATGEFADLPLVRQPRLSVMPFSRAHWHRIRELGSSAEAG